MKKGTKHRQGQRSPGAARAARSLAPLPLRPTTDLKLLVGQVFARWDKPARAIDTLDRAIAVQPARADLRRLRGHLLRRLGRLKLAAEELAEAARLALDDRELAYEMALVRLAAGGAAPETPGAAVAGARLASLAAARQGHLAAAEAALAGAALALDRLLLGVLEVVQGQSARATQLLTEVAGEEGLPPAARAYAYLYLGAAHMQRRELAAAAAALEQARAAGAPSPVEPYLSWVYQQQAVEAVVGKDLPKAAERFQALAALGGPAAAAARTNATAALGLDGQERARDGDYEGAIAAWTAALAITPQDPAIRQHLAIALERAGRTDEAIPQWHELIRLLPRGERRAGKRGRQPPDDLHEEPVLHDHTRAVAHQHLADLYLDAGDVERAVEQLEKAVQAVPADAEARRTLARLLLEEGRAKAAVRHFEQLVAGAPDSAADRSDLGVALLHAGAHEAAREQLERALALEPESPVVRLVLGSVLAGAVLAAPGRSDALRDAQHAVDLAPPGHTSMALGALGAAQLAQGDLRAAKKSLRQAIKASTTKPLTTIRVGHIYWNAGYGAEAVTAWAGAMKQGRRVACVYSRLVEAWATAGDAARCQESLAGGLHLCGVECVAEAVARVAGAPHQKPALALLRQVLRTAYDGTDGPHEQVDLVELLAVAGDVPAARTRLNALARASVQLGDESLVQAILDLDTEYRLLDRKAADSILGWLGTTTPGGLGAVLPGFQGYQAYQEKGWERWDR